MKNINIERKKIMTIIFISLILLVICILIIFSINRYNIQKQNKIKEFNEIIDKKNTKILFLTEDSNAEVNDILNNVKKYYNIDYITINKDINKELYNQVIKKLNIDKNLYITPTIIYIEDGTVKNSLINFQTENSLTDFLVTNNIIEEKEVEERKNLNEKEYNKIIKNEMASLILLYSNDEQLESINKIIKDIENNYIELNYFYVNITKNPNIESSINSKIENKNYPILILTSKSNIVDSIGNFNEKDIVNFLKKYTIIN